MSKNHSPVSARTDWNALSPATKALVQMFAASPIWRTTNFQEPPSDLLDALLAAAWDRAGFGEEELRKNPETVVGALKKLVIEQLQAN
jgi:hypothetical protein